MNAYGVAQGPMVDVGRRRRGEDGTPSTKSTKFTKCTLPSPQPRPGSPQVWNAIDQLSSHENVAPFLFLFEFLHIHFTSNLLFYYFMSQFFFFSFLYPLLINILLREFYQQAKQFSYIMQSRLKGTPARTLDLASLPASRLRKQPALLSVFQ